MNRVSTSTNLLLTMVVSLVMGQAARAEGPSVDEMKKSSDRGLFLGQPAWVKPSPSQPATPSQPAPKAKEASAAPTTKKAPVTKVSTGKAINSHKSAAKVIVAKSKKSTPATVQLVKNQNANTGSAHVQTVAYDADTIITAWLNKPGNAPKYRDGEKMEINVKASRDCNVTIYDYDGKGKLTQIFPNQFQPNTAVKSGETVTIGGPDSEFDYQLSIQPGEHKVNERIFIFAYPTSEAPLQVAMNKPENSPFRSAEMTPEEYRKLVNQSKVFFSREVKIVPKNKSQAVGEIKTVAQESVAAPNKIELSLTIEK